MKTFIQPQLTLMKSTLKIKWLEIK